MKKILYILFFILIYGCNENNNKKVINHKSFSENEQLDSLQKLLVDLDSKKYDTIIRNKYSLLAGIYYKRQKLENYYIVSKSFEKKAVEVKDTLGMINAKSNLGLYYRNKFIIDSSYFYFTKAEKLSLKTKKAPFMGAILLNKSTILWGQKDFSGAESNAIKALKIAKDKKYYDDASYCFIIIANSLLGMNNNYKALEYYNKSLKEIDNIKDNSTKYNYRVAIFNYIANIYQKEKQYQKVINYLNDKIDFQDLKNKNIIIYAYLTNNISYSKFKLGDKSSLNQFKETLNIGDSIKNIPIQITSKNYLGEYYLAQKDTLKANYYLKKAQLQAHQNDIFEDELKILKLLERANPNNETFYSNRYIELNDSLQNVERATRDKFARIEFETDEITSQKEVVSKENNILYKRIWIISGFSLLGLLVIVLWFMNKSQKSKTRELLLKQEQQKANEAIYQLMIDQQQQIEEGKNIEKQRISLELHDGVMGKLSAVRLNLYAALYKANLIEDELFSKQIDEIQEVEKEIRTIAHDLNSNLFSDNANFIGIVKELFSKIENHSQIHFSLQVSEAVNWDLINNVIKINLYRILQEALQNIEKYSNAKNVAVVMTLTEMNEINIVISDDGNGFDINQKKNGIGINNMKARITELNGKFSIQSELQKGTQINLTIPF